MITSDYPQGITGCYGQEVSKTEIHQPATCVRVFRDDEWPRMKNIVRYSVSDVWVYSYDFSWIKGQILEIYQMADGIVIMVLER